METFEGSRKVILRMEDGRVEAISESNFRRICVVWKWHESMTIDTAAYCMVLIGEGPMGSPLNFAWTPIDRDMRDAIGTGGKLMGIEEVLS